jgi:hypothetical protein
MFTDLTRQRFPETHWVLLRDLEKIVEALEANSADSYAFSLTLDPVAHFNAYIDFAIAVYLDKFKQLYQCVTTSIELDGIWSTLRRADRFWKTPLRFGTTQGTRISRNSFTPGTRAQ